MKNTFALIENMSTLVSKNFKKKYIKENLKCTGYLFNDSTINSNNTIVNFGKNINSILFLEKTYGWTPCHIKIKEEILAKISELNFLREKDKQKIITCLSDNSFSKLSTILTAIEDEIIDNLKDNLNTSDRSIFRNLRKIAKEFKSQLESESLYEELKEIIKNLNDYDLEVIKLINLLSQIKQTESLSKASKYITNIFDDLEEVEEIEDLSAFIEKTLLYEKFVLLNIAFCEDNLIFELPILTDSNLYQQIVTDLSIVKHFIFESLVPENIIYNKTKEQYELYNVTPIGINKDIEIDWMELLEGKKQFYHHANLSFSLSYNDIIESGVDINEY